MTGGNPFAPSAMSGLIRPIHGILRRVMKREWLRMSIDIHRKIEDRFRGSAIPLVALMVFFVILAALIVAPSGTGPPSEAKIWKRISGT